MDQNTKNQESKRQAHSYSIVRSASIAGGLFFLDAFVLNQGVLASLICLGMVLIMLINTFRHRKDLKKRMIIMGIYAAAAVLTIGAIRFNNHVARQHAEIIIQACEQYKNQKAMFPARLEDLVPEYLKQVPRAKYAFSYNQFTYRSRPDWHTLMYVAFPPFGRKIYTLENREWGQLD
jgi:hypothetical protein